MCICGPAASAFKSVRAGVKKKYEEVRKGRSEPELCIKRWNWGGGVKINEGGDLT